MFLLPVTVENQIWIFWNGLFSRESLDRKLKNVHRRMAGKLCGPSSSKASPASTPIPLGTAKHKILKSNDKYYTYLHTYARAYTHTRAHTYAHTHVRIAYMTHTNTFGRSISREKMLAFLQKHSLSSKQERRNGKKRNG